MEKWTSGVCEGCNKTSYSNCRRAALLMFVTYGSALSSVARVPDFICWGLFSWKPGRLDATGPHKRAGQLLVRRAVSGKASACSPSERKAGPSFNKGLAGLTFFLGPFIPIYDSRWRTNFADDDWLPFCAKIDHCGHLRLPPDEMLRSNTVKTNTFLNNISEVNEDWRKVKTLKNKLLKTCYST